MYDTANLILWLRKSMFSRPIIIMLTFVILMVEKPQSQPNILLLMVMWNMWKHPIQPRFPLLKLKLLVHSLKTTVTMLIQLLK